MRRAGIIPYLAVAAFALASVFGLVSGPATGAPSEHVGHVIVAGAAGLRWDDVNPTDTPTLWRLAEQGSIGALSVRSAHSPTCPADGWLGKERGWPATWSGSACCSASAEVDTGHHRER